MIGTFFRSFFVHPDVSSNLVWRSIQMLLRQGVVIILVFIAAKVLGAHDYGIYSYLISIIVLVGMFGDFGISTSISRYVAESNSNNAAPQVLFQGLLIVGFLGIFAIPILAAIAAFFAPDYLSELLIAAPILVFSPMVAVYDGVFRGLRNFKKLAFLSGWAAIPALSVGLFFTYTLGLRGALLSMVVVYLVPLTLYFLEMKPVASKPDLRLYSNIGRYSISVGSASLTFYLFSQIPVFFWGHLGSFELVGTYTLLSRVSSIILTPFYIVGQVVAPHFSLISSRRDYEKIRAAVIKDTYVYAVAGAVIASALCLFLPYFFTIFFADYLIPNFWTILYVSMFVLGLNVASASIDTGIIVATGYAWIMSRLFFISCITEILAGICAVVIDRPLLILYANAAITCVLLITVRLIFLRKLGRSIDGERVRFEP